MPFPDELARGLAVVAYDRRWPDDFAVLAQRIQGALGSAAVQVSHVGSTSVPGMAAKDCIDVQVEVQALYEDLIAGCFGKIGFRLRPEPWNHVEATPEGPGPKLVFAPPAGERASNIHVVEAAGEAARRKLLFRDFLRAHDTARDAWSDFKQRLAAMTTDIYQYGQAKAGPTQILMIAAESWARQTQWAPLAEPSPGARVVNVAFSAQRSTSWPEVDPVTISPPVASPVRSPRSRQRQCPRAQAEVGVKTNEVPMATDVLGQIDLNGKIVTADALHTVKATAEFISERGGEFVLPVKENRQALFDALDALPWDQVPVAHAQTDRGHGRVTTRTIQVMPAPADLPFPHVSQVLLIERYVNDLAGNPLSAVAALGVASPGPDKASPADLARYVRGQWAIEVRMHRAAR